MLGLLALLGFGLSMAGPAWRDQVQRERETEWLRIGTLYAQALDSYVQSAPGSMTQPPAQLDDLLLDTRFIGVRRHLRQTYTDPLQPTLPWQLLRDEEGRIVGVFSSFEATPFLTQPPAGSRVQWRPQGSGYSRWAFVVAALPTNPSASIR
ncbi:MULTISPECIES: hypothetical protein [unclassified Roseateles]|uniref:hypothetical protein n=1 Tax=unclassified Roseateles TaxID=2626991 RepID=UPI0007022FE0|nr:MULTISPECIES: hypothetical protein [unclassified Roseateles]KQW42928.1 hypothetical protein ASC81_19960 [Pelomonas sp. Root405]KRA69606.1 hypothetical protein ASD88_20610 [Pelomonas sp. Root662]